MKYRLGELYCGAGGAVLGASAATYLGSGFEHEWITDWNDDALETIRQNGIVPDEKVISSDVRDLDLTKLPDIDGLMFGFPCNDFSVIRQSKFEHFGLAGKYGYGAVCGVECLNAKKPMFFVAENVPGLLTVNGGEDFRAIRTAMEFAGGGYDVAAHIFRMEEYGIPQRRKRIIFVGFRKDLEISFWPPAPHGDRVLVGEALRDIPHCAKHHIKYPLSALMESRLKYVGPGENCFTAEMPEAVRRKSFQRAHARRVAPDRVAPTLIGESGEPLHHWEEMRQLTLRELARLQTFPDDYDFAGSRYSIHKQIGMAIPPEFARIIFESVLQHLMQAGISPRS